MDKPWRSLGFFRPAEIKSKSSLWLSLTMFIQANGVEWEPFKGDVTTDVRYQVPELNHPASFTPGNVGWHPDGNAALVVVWASRDPTMIRWRRDDGSWSHDQPEPYEVALIDNRRAEHCAPESIGGERWFYRAFVKA